MEAKVRTTLVAAVSLCVSCSGDSSTSPDAASDAISIGFDRFPGSDGILGTADDVTLPACDHPVQGCILVTLTDEYHTIGVDFVNWTVHFNSRYGHYVNYGSGIQPTPRVVFSRPVYGISVTSYSIWSLRLTTRDALGNTLHDILLPHPNEGCLTTCPEIHGTVQADSRVPIHDFAIETVRQSPVESGAGLTFKSVALDNLVVFTAPP